MDIPLFKNLLENLLIAPSADCADYLATLMPNIFAKESAEIV